MTAETKGKKVALALSSGGPRGFAYIGAIEELTARGYTVSSVAGTSIGSLIGGIYSAGHLEDVKDWLFSLDALKVFKLMDLSMSKNHLVKGDKVIEAIKGIVPDVKIESLPIPFRAVATDLFTGEAIVFSSGNLFSAIRASISIPSLFRPVKMGTRTLVDGGIANCLPISELVRTEGDISLAFDVNSVEVEKINSIIELHEAKVRKEQALEESISAEKEQIIKTIIHDDTLPFLEKIKVAKNKRKILLHSTMLGESKKTKDEEVPALEADSNYFSILGRTFSLMNHVNTELTLDIYKPDILVRMPFDTFGEISDYARAKDISEMGRELMAKALDDYEKGLTR